MFSLTESSLLMSDFTYKNSSNTTVPSSREPTITGSQRVSFDSNISSASASYHRVPGQQELRPPAFFNSDEVFPLVSNARGTSTPLLPIQLNINYLALDSAGYQSIDDNILRDIANDFGIDSLTALLDPPVLNGQVTPPAPQQTTLPGNPPVTQSEGQQAEHPGSKQGLVWPDSLNIHGLHTTCAPVPPSSLSTAKMVENGKLSDRLDRSTWAARNPAQPINITRAPPRQLTEAENATQKLAADQRKLHRDQLNEDIKKYIQSRNEQLEMLAEKHNMTIERTKALTGLQATFKKPRAPNMYNVIVHAKSLEVNADLPVGEKKCLQELQSLAKVEQGPEGLCEDKQEEMRSLLLEHREIKSSGVRFNNAAAARDLMCTADRIGRELNNLALCTGSYRCFFLTRGHVNDLGAATWYGSDNSLNFWEDVIDRDPDEIAQLFEQWGCSRNQNTAERDNLQNCHRQCARACKIGLRQVLGRTTKMDYEKYETAIVSLHSVKIVGWPTNIPFVNPSAIGMVAEIRQLCDTWRNGTCHWIKLTPSKLKAYRTELEAWQNAGEVTQKKRKKQLDAGLPRKHQQTTQNKNKENTTRTMNRRTAVRRAPISAETIESSSEDLGDNE